MRCVALASGRVVAVNEQYGLLLPHVIHCVTKLL